MQNLWDVDERNETPSAFSHMMMIVMVVVVGGGDGHKASSNLHADFWKRAFHWVSRK